MTTGLCMTATGPDNEGDGRCCIPYVLLGQHDRGLYEYHVYCTLGPEEHLEFVTPDGEVVATWPDDVRAGDETLVARGDRFFHPRGDLKVRSATGSSR
jgi:hypothetical protein